MDLDFSIFGELSPFRMDDLKILRFVLILQKKMFFPSLSDSFLMFPNGNWVISGHQVRMYFYCLKGDAKPPAHGLLG